MPTPVKMPRLGESVAEGTVGAWLKNEGDWVERDESLAEIITDKINAELPSPVAGRLTKILVKADETVAVGVDIALIEESADVSAAPPTQEAPAVMAATAAPTGNGASAAVGATRTGQEDQPRISPLARRLAEEHGIDLNMVVGTGASGRVRKEDILAYVAMGPQQAAGAAATTSAPPAVA